jgi:hypothetical protein
VLQANSSQETPHRELAVSKRIMLKAICVAVALTAGFDGYCQEQRTVVSEGVRTVRLEAFVRSDLPAAEQVETYAADLRKRIPGLEVVIHDVLKDREQLLKLHELTKKFGKAQAVVPSFYACNRMVFGFADGQKSGPSIERLLCVQVYTRETCQRCQSAKVFITKLKTRWPALRFEIFDISYDNHARMTWERLCRETGQPPGLPTFDFGGRVLIGYQGDDITGVELERLIEKVSGVDEHEPVSKTEQGKETSNTDKDKNSGPSKNDHSLLLTPLLWNAGILFIPHQETSSEPASEQMLEVDQPASSEQTDIDPLLLPSAAAESELSDTAKVATVDVVANSGSIRLPYFGTLNVSDMGLPGFTLAVGLVDGFNPCAMWVLVFLLSVLVNIRDRWKIVAIAGTFVVVSGLAYLAFMAAWLNLFMLIGIARPVQVILGIFAIAIGLINMKDFFAFKKGISLSIPESSKPGLYRRVREIVNAKYLTAAVAGAVALAIVVNMIELLCTAGLPALYTQILTLQQLPAWQNYLYLGLYISAYMLDDTLLLGVVVLTLSHRKLQEREGQWLKLISGLVILLLGLIMIFRPSWLQLGH